MLRIGSTIFLVLSAYALHVDGCDDTAIQACMGSSAPAMDGTPCDAGPFQTCINNAGIDQCEATNQNYQNAQNIILGCESQKCGAALSSCMLDASTSLLNLGQQFANGGGIAASTQFICVCEENSGEDTGIAKELTDCLEASDYKDCPAAIKTELDKQVTNFTTGIQSSLAMCGMIEGYLQGDCDCVKGGNECVKNHMGSDFETKRAAMLDGESIEYPKCLDFGTEQEFKDTFQCLRNLPAECGYKNFDPTSFLDMQAAVEMEDADPNPNPNPNEAPAMPTLPNGMKYLPAFDIVYMAYICTEGCANPNATALKAVPCLTEAGVDLKKTPAQILALEGTDKDEFCAKMTTASRCAAEKMSECPIVALTTARLIDDLKEERPSISTGHDIPVDLTMFSACDIDLEEYIELGDLTGETSGSVVFNPQPLLMVLVASVLRWML